MMNKNIILGTAQFGMDYGITNSKGKLNEKDCINILEEAKRRGINTLDTAQDYGNAELILGNNKFISNKFQINTKLNLSAIDLNSKKTLNIFDKKLEKSLKRLNRDKLNSLMIHNGEILSTDCEVFIEWIKSCKSENKIKNFGASIYEDSEIPENILKDLDFVQVPYSIFNQRIVKGNLLKLCSKNNTKIHVRSILCQGLMLSSLNNLPRWVEKRDKVIFEKIQNYLIRNNHSMMEYACSFINSQSWIDSIVIGVTNIKELIQLVDALKIEDFFDYEILSKYSLKFSEKFIDPRKWHQKST